MTMILQCADKSLDLSAPKIMGILNITPDSFSDGGQYFNTDTILLDKILENAHRMVTEGVSILDIGGESTRPGAEPVSTQQELDRVLPVIELLLKELDVIISADTSDSIVMEEAIKMGVHMINDVRALQNASALEVVARSNVSICLMHMSGEPCVMQNNPTYDNVVEVVKNFLSERVSACLSAGIDKTRLVIDPGFGFGKTTRHNIDLLKHLSHFNELKLPILVGLSRKSMIGNIIDRPVNERIHGSLAATVIALLHHAKIIRTHDVAAVVDAVKITTCIMHDSN